MDSVRSFANNNRSTIINVVYVVAFLVAVYFLYKFLVEGSDLEVTLLNAEVDANKPLSYMIPPKQGLRVKTGGEYTISFWMYISSWDYRSGLPKSVLQIFDQTAVSSPSTKNLKEALEACKAGKESDNSSDTTYVNNSYSLLTTMLYPNEAKMMVRVHTDSPPSDGQPDYTNLNAFNNLMSGGQGASMFSPSVAMPVCDVQDIDLQRWINITISVNGRIVDVYYDGKLNRSCVLPDIPTAPDQGVQSVVIGQSGGFGGKMSQIQFFGYPLTPDRIYSIYQAGPASAGGLLGYVSEKFGINLSYSGAKGTQKSFAF